MVRAYNFLNIYYIIVMKRICNYRNCQKEVEGKKNKQYCNRSCKTQEQTYRKREIKKQIKENGK